MSVTNYIVSNLITGAQINLSDLFHVNHREKNAHSKWPRWMIKITMRKNSAPAGINFLAEKAEIDGFQPNALERNLILSYMGNGAKEELEKSGWKFKKSLTEVNEDALNQACIDHLGTGLATVLTPYNPVYDRDYSDGEVINSWLNLYLPVGLVTSFTPNFEAPFAKQSNVSRIIKVLYENKLPVPPVYRDHFSKFITLDENGVILALSPAPAKPVEAPVTEEVKKNESEAPAPVPCAPVSVPVPTVPEELIVRLPGVTTNYINVTEVAFTGDVAALTGTANNAQA